MKFIKYFWMSILFSTALTTAEPFRFGWFTDTHVGTAGGERDLRACVAEVNSDTTLQFVIVSGDITELDVRDNLMIAKRVLDSLNVPYHIIPGNHDTKWSSSGGELFRRLWGRDHFCFEYDGIVFLGFDQGPLMKMADGFVSPQNLSWLEKETQKIASDGKDCFVVTHYPLDESVANAADVLRMLYTIKPQAILHGHGHANRFRGYGGIPGIMSRSTLRPPPQRRQHFHDGQTEANGVGENEYGGFSIVTLWPDSLIEVAEHLNFSGTKAAWLSLKWNSMSCSPDSLAVLIQDFSVNENCPLISEGWRYQTGAAITTAPLLYGKNMYMTTTGGDVLCLNSINGKEVWRNNYSAPIYSEPSVYKGHLVFGGTDSLIRCLNTKDGKLLWKFKGNASFVSSPAIDQGIVYLGGSGGIFYALDIQNGHVLWTYEKIAGFVETKPLIYKNKVIFGAWDNHMYALNTADGSLVWTWYEGPNGVLYSPAAVYPQGAYGKIFIVAPDRVMSAINAESGETVWRKEGMVVRESIGLGNRSRTVFARSMRDTIWAVSTTGNEYKCLWKSGIDYGFDINPSSLIETNGVLYIPAQDGFLYALNSMTGELLWTYRAGKGLVNTPVIKDDKIYLTNMDGEVICLRMNKQDDTEK